MTRLKKMGFRRCGSWSFQNGRLNFVLTDNGQDQNVLYAFISDGEVLYIGKTVQPLKKRMCGYQNPGPTQSTNIKGNEQIRGVLEVKNPVEIYTLPDNGLLYYGGFHVNLAAGLEDSLVKELQPAWNRSGK
ncbi:GIY-YIG nuclease family protein [Marinobacter sp.]|uniref:GIY-YIG nuclease family protein n=1 Tax=Marinobacter sp. TaxID=50741 RepID=UPI0035C7147F